MNFTLFSFVFIILLTTGCSSIIGSASQKMATNLSIAMQNQDDIETVKAAAPAYLIMLDSLIEGDSENVSLLHSAAKLYASYSGAFVKDAERAKRLSSKSMSYARKALCIELPALCNIEHTKLDSWQPVLSNLPIKKQSAIYAFADAWASWIKAHSDDWNALAQVPKLTALLKHSVLLNDRYEQGGAYLYLGVLSSQLPPSLGGKPEQGLEYFEKALSLSQGKNLMTKVLMAEHYARLVFDQEMHDRLLKEVLASNPHQPNLTLINTLAQIRASELLAESPDFF